MEKVEEAKQSVIIPNNVERTFYEITIEDIKKRIERLETRNEQLIEIQEQVKNDSTSTDVNTTNEIAQLNRDLSVELNKIANAQKAIDLLNNQRHEEQNRHDSKVNFIKQMHDNTRKELLCQIKISNAKINALEDFHNNEECIREKMRKNDDFLVEKEEKLKAKFNQLDIAFKIFRAK
ncbi:GSCOCG00005928001-RA-CDS [Cotesia congregata]|nr:GSCOCG00005928001-RA-CDS [Cotesia congregata]